MATTRGDFSENSTKISGLSHWISLTHRIDRTGLACIWPAIGIGWKLKSIVFRLTRFGILDVSILQNNILSPILNMLKDPRTDNRVDFIGGIRGLAELVKKVDSGQAAAAFSLYPVSMDQLFLIADHGEIHAPEKHLV